MQRMNQYKNFRKPNGSGWFIVGILAWAGVIALLVWILGRPL